MHTDLLLNQAEIRLEIPSSFLFLSSAVQWFGVTLKSTPVKSRLRLTASVLYRHLFSFRSTGSLRRVDPACLSSSKTLRKRPGVCFDHTHKWNIVTSVAPLFFFCDHTLVEIFRPNIINIHLHREVHTQAVKGSVVLTSRALHWPRVSRNAPSHTLSCRDGEERESQ